MSQPSSTPPAALSLALIQAQSSQTAWQGETATPVPCVPGFRAVTFETREAIDFDIINPFLLEYVATQAAVLERVSGVSVDASSAHTQGFWASIEKVLPPNGRFYVVWSDAGTLAGTAALRRVDGTTGEMKQLYVRPEARGTGLGRWLVEQRLRDAKALGLETIVADTLKGNVEMPALYAKLGFDEIPANPTAASVQVMPFLVDHMLFYRKVL